MVTPFAKHKNYKILCPFSMENAFYPTKNVNGLNDLKRKMKFVGNSSKT